MVKLIKINPEKHGRFLFEARQLPEVARYMYNEDEIIWENHLDWLQNLFTNQSRADWVVEFNGELAGHVNLTSIDKKNKRADFGMYIASEGARIQGVGAAAEFLALEYAFKVLNLKKVSCEVFSSNEAPIRMHQRMGFVKEGVLRKHAVYENEWIDVIRLSILDEEWRESKSLIKKAIQRLLGSGE